MVLSALRGHAGDGWLPVALSCAIAVFGIASIAAAADAVPRKGETITLKLPTVYLSKGCSGLLEDRPTYIVDLVEEQGRISPWGAPQWRTAGFPDLGQFDVSKIRTKKDYTEVELKSDERVVKLRFLSSVGDVAAAFAEVTAPGRPDSPDVRRYLESLFPLLAGSLLEGDAADLPADVRAALVEAIYETGGEARLATERYREASYLVVRLGRVTPPPRLFVSNPVARAAIFMNASLLTAARQFREALAGQSRFDGLKVDADLPRRGSAEKEEASTDHLEWYAPWEPLGRFAADEITSAELLDNSIVLLQDNRVEMPLDVAR